jgi:monoamine oxidase
MREFDVIIIGAGAAGVAAARRLKATPLSVKVLEARGRIGGRAWTIDGGGNALDLGCGWLHSAEENDWSALAAELGLHLDRTPPPWSRPALTRNFPQAEQADFRAALLRFYERLDAAADDEPDHRAVDLLEPGCRWNELINALSTYINGVELDRVSVRDYGRYHDTGVNWRVREGYGRLIEAAARGCDLTLECPVTRIDHSGRRIRVHTPQGALDARAVIITVPPSVIAADAITFTPALPDKVAAAHALPLGLADKLFLRLDAPDDFPPETRIVGATDRAATATYHLRPFGRPLVEVYFGGAFARELEAQADGFAQFARAQLAALLGADAAKRIHPLAASAWGRDPFARGAYSYARIGHADARAALAAPVDERLFFAGEACSRHDFSTAHGAYRTGVAAAEASLHACEIAMRRHHG